MVQEGGAGSAAGTVQQRLQEIEPVLPPTWSMLLSKTLAEFIMPPMGISGLLASNWSCERFPIEVWRAAGNVYACEACVTRFAELMTLAKKEGRKEQLITKVLGQFSYWIALPLHDYADMHLEPVQVFATVRCPNPKT